MTALGDYTVALLIGRALHLAAAGAPEQAAVQELSELADGRDAALVEARHHYDDLVGDGADLESALALHLLSVALRATRRTDETAIGGRVLVGGAAIG